MQRVPFDTFDTSAHSPLQVYHAFYKPLEFYLPNRDASNCYIKVSVPCNTLIPTCMLCNVL